MKILFSIILILSYSLSYSQSNKQKLSKDSIRYYQKQLSELSKATYDSMIKSEKYKILANKLNLTNKKSVDNFGVELSLLLGYQKNTYANLNTRFDSLKVNRVNSSLSPVGIGLAFRFNKFIIGYDMSILIGNKTSGAYIHGYVSTNILRMKRWIISPQFGYGGQNISVRIPVQSSSANFNSYFTTSSNKVEIKHSNSVLDFAFAFKLYPKPNNENYLPLLRIGYRYGLNEKRWEIIDGNSANAPIDRNSNFYLQLILGFGN